MILNERKTKIHVKQFSLATVLSLEEKILAKLRKFWLYHFVSMAITNAIHPCYSILHTSLTNIQIGSQSLFVPCLVVVVFCLVFFVDIHKKIYRSRWMQTPLGPIIYICTGMFHVIWGWLIVFILMFSKMLRPFYLLLQNGEIVSDPVGFEIVVAIAFHFF